MDPFSGWYLDDITLFDKVAVSKGKEKDYTTFDLT